MADYPIIVCLTPVKNESWIIERFLQCASLWADHIILADQSSQDNTIAIAAKFKSVQIIKNASDNFDEYYQRNILIQESRKIKGKHILIAIDADEILFFDKKELRKIKKAAPGSSFSLDWINIHPNLKQYWKTANQKNIIYVDDGQKFESGKIHCNIVPVNHKVETIQLTHSKLLHYQYSDWDRMKSKHNWYQCWETLHFPDKASLNIYRQYHHMYSIQKKQLSTLEEKWFRPYLDAGIEMFSITKENNYYWDELIYAFFKKYGTNRFSKIAIWDKPWENYEDPRSIEERLLHLYLEKTQKISHSLFVRLIDKILRTILL